MKYLLILLSAVCVWSCSKPKEDTSGVEQWESIFNQKDMSGWQPKFTGFPAGENIRNTFRITDDSLLSVRYDEWEKFQGEFGHLWYTDKAYSHYRIRATYRFVGDQVTDGPRWAYRNNGLMLHSQSIESMGLDQDFPVSIEYQLLGGNGTDERSTCNLCTPGTNVYMADTLFTPHCINSTSPTFHGDQWVTVEAVVLGDSLIEHIVDSKVVMTYTKPTRAGGMASGLKEGVALDDSPLKSGYITIQAETAPIDFASIEVLDLCGCTDPKAKNYKSYFVKSDNSRCEY